MRFPAALCLAAVATGGCAVSAAPPAPVGHVVLAGEQERGEAAYLGSAACGACHAGAYERWRATGHARDFAGLQPADRGASPCLRCHVTGYGDRLGYRAAGGPPDLANIGCEACHGPGADHGRSAHPEFVPTRTGGECPPCEINKLCRLCHTPERSAGFDLPAALAKVSCKP
jgi:hypothetical protein